jgi:hypothetical protein
MISEDPGLADTIRLSSLVAYYLHDAIVP